MPDSLWRQRCDPTYPADIDTSTEIRCFTDLEQELERLRLFAHRVEEAATDSALTDREKLGVIRALLWKVKHER